MFRITQYIDTLVNPTPLGPQRKPGAPVVIWNLIRRCNLTCKHCYTTSADIDFKGELDTDEVFTVIEDLRRFKVPMLILSGGEPLLRPDIFEVLQYAKELEFMLSLSTNGTLIDASNSDRIEAADYDYVGISLDGIGETHDRFRQKQGSFAASRRGQPGMIPQQHSTAARSLLLAPGRATPNCLLCARGSYCGRPGAGV